MGDSLRVMELKNQLKVLINELDSFSSDPFTLDYKDKTVDVTVYQNGAVNSRTERKAYIGVNKGSDSGNNYYNAIQQLGAFLSLGITQRTDYVVLSKIPEETIKEKLLEYYIIEKYGIAFEDYDERREWEKQFQVNKEDYVVDINEYYIVKYSEILEDIKKANEKRTKKKKDPLPPITVIWEEQMYEYLLEQDAFNKDTLICKCTLTLANTSPYQFRHLTHERVWGYIEDGKSVLFSIYTKQGKQDEINKALEHMKIFKRYLPDSAVIENEPIVEGNNVTMLVRSNKSDKEALLKVYIEESDSVKLERAVKMFAASVEMVEKRLDLDSNNYAHPIVQCDFFEGKRVIGLEKCNAVMEYLNAIKTWMSSNDMKYDYDSTPEEITDCIKRYFYQATSKENGHANIDGLVSVRIPLGVAIAYLNYASPFSKIRFDFAHDKWEYRGEYNTNNCVTVYFKRFDEMPEIY